MMDPDPVHGLIQKTTTTTWEGFDGTDRGNEEQVRETNAIVGRDDTDLHQQPTPVVTNNNNSKTVLPLMSSPHVHPSGATGFSSHVHAPLRGNLDSSTTTLSSSLSSSTRHTSLLRDCFIGGDEVEGQRPKPVSGEVSTPSGFPSLSAISFLGRPRSTFSHHRRYSIGANKQWSSAANPLTTTTTTKTATTSAAAIMRSRLDDTSSPSSPFFLLPHRHRRRNSFHTASAKQTPLSPVPSESQAYDRTFSFPSSSWSSTSLYTGGYTSLAMSLVSGAFSGQETVSSSAGSEAATTNGPILRRPLAMTGRQSSQDGHLQQSMQPCKLSTGAEQLNSSSSSLCFQQESSSPSSKATASLGNLREKLPLSCADARTVFRGTTTSNLVVETDFASSVASSSLCLTEDRVRTSGNRNDKTRQASMDVCRLAAERPGHQRRSSWLIAAARKQGWIPAAVRMLGVGRVGTLDKQATPPTGDCDDDARPDLSNTTVWVCKGDSPQSPLSMVMIWEHTENRDDEDSPTLSALVDDGECNNRDEEAVRVAPHEKQLGENELTVQEECNSTDTQTSSHYDCRMGQF